MWFPGKTRRWSAGRQIDWEIGKKGSGWVHSIPKGTEFESSVPSWVPRKVLSQDDPRLLLAAVVHDTLLESGHRAFFAAGEWYDAALKGGYPKLPALILATIIGFRGSLRSGAHEG